MQIEAGAAYCQRPSLAMFLRLVSQVLDFEQWFASMYASEEDVAAAPTVGPDGEPLDDGEAFELQQMERVIAEDPESLAFHNARKVLAATKVIQFLMSVTLLLSCSLIADQGGAASKTKRK